ncbi:hypothetical protein RRG08_045057 [Elysia crispata]|uniref:Uncharacterized protein n=1 Tax=Elysia crispata TaxID=231223 RepID=A0AAE0XTN2_9GAST|nr:hypothetical protein RRG08_045057 [Elysia crispata]
MVHARYMSREVKVTAQAQAQWRKMVLCGRKLHIAYVNGEDNEMVTAVILETRAVMRPKPPEITGPEPGRVHTPGIRIPTRLSTTPADLDRDLLSANGPELGDCGASAFLTN